MWIEASTRNFVPVWALVVLALVGDAFGSVAAEAGSVAKKVGSLDC
jgi:hypothetical protein